MLPFKLIYHEGYDLNLGGHVLTSQKYRMVRGRLLTEKFAEPDDFIQREPATDEDLLLVHEPGWITRLREGTLGGAELAMLEIPYSKKMVDAFLLGAGGSILAARRALRDGVALQYRRRLSSRLSRPRRGLLRNSRRRRAIRRVQKDGLVERAMVVDTYVHHGNGTAAIFASDLSVFTLSIHQHYNYPHFKPPSDLDIHLENGVADDEYRERLAAACKQSTE